MTYFASATLFERNGTTAIQPLSSASELRWLDTLEEVGSFSFTIGVEYAPSIGIGQIVKIAYGDTSDDYVFAGVIESLELQQVDAGSDGIARTWRVSGRGAAALLEDAVVHSTASPIVSERTFTSTNVGAMMKTLIDEAQTRGALGALTFNFTNSVDSDGNAYTQTSLTMVEQVGTNLLEVADRHQEIAVDFFIDPDGGASGAVQLRYVNSRGTNKSTGTNPVVLRVGQNVSELADQKTGPIRNHVLIATGSNSYTSRNDGASISTYGRRETFLAMSENSDASITDLSGDHILNQQANPTDGTTVRLIDAGVLPYIDFGIGDTILLARLDGSRTAYRVRSISGSVDEAGVVTFIPELGTTRPDLTKRLAVALQRAEAKNAADSKVADQPGGTSDLGSSIGEEIPEYVFGEVLTYDSLTGYGTIEVDGTTYDFYNGAFAGLNVGDIIFGVGGDFIGGAPGAIDGVDFIVSNVITSDAGYGGGYPGGTSVVTTVPVSAVPGLPYTTGGQFAFHGAADGCVWRDTGVVTDYTNGQTYTIARPSSAFGSCWGLVNSANGPWVFVNSGVTSNGLHIVYNGTGTTSNYGSCQVLGTHSNHIWVWAGYKAGSVDRRILGISSTGTIAHDFTSADLNNLNSAVNTTVGRAGEWGIVLWDGTDVVTVETPTGTPAYRVDISLNFPSLPDLGNNIFRSAISDTNLVWITTTNTDRDWRRWEFATNTRYDYLDVLDVGFKHDCIASLGGSTVLIAGDTGSGGDQAYAITSGSTVVTTTFADTDDGTGFLAANNPAYEVLARTRAQAAPNSDTLIGVTA